MIECFVPGAAAAAQAGAAEQAAGAHESGRALHARVPAGLTACHP